MAILIWQALLLYNDNPEKDCIRGHFPQLTSAKNDEMTVYGEDGFPFKRPWPPGSTRSG